MPYLAHAQSKIRKCWVQLVCFWKCVSWDLADSQKHPFAIEFNFHLSLAKFHPLSTLQYIEMRLHIAWKNYVKNSRKIL